MYPASYSSPCHEDLAFMMPRHSASPPPFPVVLFPVLASVSFSMWHTRSLYETVATLPELKCISTVLGSFHCQALVYLLEGGLKYYSRTCSPEQQYLNVHVGSDAFHVFVFKCMCFLLESPWGYALRKLLDPKVLLRLVSLQWISSFPRVLVAR